MVFTEPLLNYKHVHLFLTGLILIAAMVNLIGFMCDKPKSEY